MGYRNPCRYCNGSMAGRPKQARHCSEACKYLAGGKTRYALGGVNNPIDPKWLTRGDITYNGTGTAINPGG